jgi:hypothetical protein
MYIADNLFKFLSLNNFLYFPALSSESTTTISGSTSTSTQLKTPTPQPKIKTPTPELKVKTPTPEPKVPTPEPVSKNTDWEVSIYTSKVKMAGTDAKVYFSLIGEHGESKIIQAPSTAKHQSGKIDVVNVNFEDIGELKQLRIGHDNSGLGPGWHLSKVCSELLCKHLFKTYLIGNCT